MENKVMILEDDNLFSRRNQTDLNGKSITRESNTKKATDAWL